MVAKIQILYKQINSFGGIFYVISQFRSSGQAALIDKTLGVKGINTKFSYSNVVENLTSIFVSGGEVLEDVNFFRQEAFKANPDYRFCSADTIGRDLRGLAVANTEFQAVTSGKTYQFNINGRLNDLLLKGLLELGMVEKDVPVIFDYDNQFIETEKYDATYSYKKANGIKVDKARMERGYRLMVQRTLVQDKQSTLFDSYVYRCVLTNDWESSEREVVEFYNQRGTSERTFDMQNNDFGWKHLPFSFMKENTVFMILTALIRNFYVWLVGEIAANKAFGLEATSRVKKFVFRSRQWHLQLFTCRPYDRLRL